MKNTQRIRNNRHGFSRRAAACIGFTLIELAVVLMVSSLLMVATIKGQGLVDIAKEKRLESDFRTIPSMLNTYQDRFRALPGDDPNVNGHLAVTGSYDGDGDGIINGNWFDDGATSDSAKIWRHLYKAGLLSDSSFATAVDVAPRNILGYRIGIQGGDASRSPIVDSSGRGMKGSYIICSSGIPGNLAQQLDVSLDDGNPSTGAMMVAQDPGPPYQQVGLLSATLGTGRDTDIRADFHYVVCMST